MSDKENYRYAYICEGITDEDKVVSRAAKGTWISQLFAANAQAESKYAI